ncbi:MAG: hypothetical protein ACXAEN_23185 [Candidatus Thorarchaeota archaeon]|jgi:hypothetical protein
MTRFEFTCADCGNHEVHEVECGGTGYARLKDGRKICYSCSAIRERNDMNDAGRATLYLVTRDDMLFVTNWTSHLEFKVRMQNTGRHNIAGVRQDVWFYDAAGNRWWGVSYGHNTQLCHCRRLAA